MSDQSEASVCFLPQFRAAGVCRRSAGDCDLPEFCTGLSADCPEDAFEMNGKPCRDHGDGYCYDGQCPTHEQHCWRLFGPGRTETRAKPRAGSALWKVESSILCLH